MVIPFGSGRAQRRVSDIYHPGLDAVQEGGEKYRDDVRAEANRARSFPSEYSEIFEKSKKENCMLASYLKL